MARSNGPIAGAGQRVQQGHPQQARAHGDHAGAPARRPQAQDAHAPGPFAHDPGQYYQTQAYGYDDRYPSRAASNEPPGHYQPQPDPYAAPPYGSEDPRQAPQPGYHQQDPYYPPAHDGMYEAPPFSGHGLEADPFARQEPSFAPPSPAGYQAHPGEAAAFQHGPDLRGPLHDQWAQPASRNPAGYDPAGYETASPSGYAPSLTAQPMREPDHGWGASDPFSPDAGGPHPHHQAVYGGEFAGYQMAEPQGGALSEQYADEELEDDYEDEPRGRSRMTLIAAALVGAIGIGGGLAYGYKTLMGPGADGAPPVVKSESAPSKMRPAEPGGKQFAHTDSKIMGRLSDTGSIAGASAASASEAESGTRKVQTLVVGRDGSIEAAAAASPTPSASAPVVSVPGMTVIDGFGASPAAAQDRTAQRPMVVSPPPAAEPAPPEKPVVIARAAPSPAPTAPPPEAKPVTTAPAAARPPVPKKVAAAAPAAAPAVARPSGAGYVAVLASVPASSSSRIEALKQFADMQQKYSAVLQSKTPDVTEANLGAKGTYHRLVIGPPSSREQASTLCSQLKSAGYSGCWVTTY